MKKPHTKIKILLCILLLSIYSSIVLATDSVTVFGSLTREHNCSPGEEVNGEILVTNQGSETVEVKVYQTDYLFFADGSTIYGEVGSVERSNSQWLSISPSLLTIPAGEEALVSYRVEVPSDNKLQGTYWSMIMIEPLENRESSELVETEDEITINVESTIRYGVQIVSHIGESGLRDLEIINKDLFQEEQDNLLLVDLENTGERWLKPEVSIELYNNEGAMLDKYDGGSSRLYPGTSKRHIINFGNLEQGEYKAMLIIDNGDQYIWGAQYNLEL